MSGANDGISTLFSMRAICSSANPVRSANSAMLICLVSRMDLIFSPTIFVLSILKIDYLVIIFS